ncbi:MAG TPA: GNAT family N-acetyltransferase [Anaerolineaceae bacterium]
MTGQPLTGQPLTGQRIPNQSSLVSAPPIPNLIVRRVRLEDLPLLEWEGEYIHFRKTYQEAFQRQQRGLSVLWLAEIPGIGVIGQVFIQLNCDRPELADGHSRAYLYAFRVREAYRSRGVGSHMLAVLEQDLRQRGFQWLTLNVARINERARMLYEKRGFRVVAPEAGIWSYEDHLGVWHTVEEPAWRMEKSLV